MQLQCNILCERRAYSCTTKYNCQQDPNAKQNPNKTGKQSVLKNFRAANGQVFSTLGQKSKAEYPFLKILQIVWTRALCCRNALYSQYLVRQLNERLSFVTLSLVSDQEWTILQTTKFSTQMMNSLMVRVLSRWNWTPIILIIVEMFQK